MLHNFLNERASSKVVMLAATIRICYNDATIVYKNVDKEKYYIETNTERVCHWLKTNLFSSYRKFTLELYYRRLSCVGSIVLHTLSCAEGHRKEL